MSTDSAPAAPATPEEHPAEPVAVATLDAVEPPPAAVAVATLDADEHPAEPDPAPFVLGSTYAAPIVNETWTISASPVNEADLGERVHSVPALRLGPLRFFVDPSSGAIFQNPPANLHAEVAPVRFAWKGFHRLKDGRVAAIFRRGN